MEKLKNNKMAYYIDTIVDDDIQYTHKNKYHLKFEGDKNEFGAIFHKNGLCQYYQYDKVKVYQSNGQVNYNYRTININQEDDLYQKMIHDDAFNLSLHNWTQDLQGDQQDQLIPIILKRDNRYYKNISQEEVLQQFWSKGKIQETERTQKFILIRMVNEISRDFVTTNTFEISLNRNKQLIFKIQKQGKIQINELYSQQLEEFYKMDQNQINNLMEFINMDSRLYHYFDKIQQNDQIENSEIMNQILYNSNKKMYLLIKKQEKRALIINEQYFYYGQYDQISPNGYGFAYYFKSNYKYKGQWIKGQKEGWGYITFYLDKDINNKKLQEKQFDRFSEDIAENLPDFENFEHIRFPLIDLNEQQIELIQTCKNIYLNNVEQLEIEQNEQESFFVDQQLSLRNSKDEQSFMKQCMNQCIKKFRITAFRNKLSGSIYQGNWSKQNMQGYGKIIYQSNNFYSGYFKQSQRDFRGLYLENLTNSGDLDIYIGYWKNDKQDSYYYEKLNLISLLYLGEFQKDQAVGQARIYDLKLYEDFQLSVPKSDIKSYFKVQVDMKILNCDYQGKSNLLQQPNPPISENILKLLNDRFRLKIQKKKDDSLTYCPLYFKMKLFDQILYYKGQWKNKQPEAEGFALNENTYIQGTFKEGSLVYGYYICFFIINIQENCSDLKCQYHYKGQFKNGLFHGDGKLRFLQQNVQLMQGQWENGIHKTLKSSTELSQGTAIKYTQQISQEYVNIALKYNFQLQKEMVGYKYVQSEDFYYGNIQNSQKNGKGTLITNQNCLYSGQFQNDQFIEGLIINQDFVQIISLFDNQLKMIEYNLNDEQYLYYGSCQLVQSSYQKEDGCQLNKDSKFIAIRQISLQLCVVELNYDENEMISLVTNIQFQLTPFMREIMNRFNIYQDYSILNPQFQYVKFDGADYFSINSQKGDLRILFNSNQIIYQWISQQNVNYMRELNLKNKTVYLGKIKNEKKYDLLAIYFDQEVMKMVQKIVMEGLQNRNKQWWDSFYEINLNQAKFITMMDHILQQRKSIVKLIKHLDFIQEILKIDGQILIKGQIYQSQNQKKTKQISALDIYNIMVKEWIDCKYLIQKMNKEGCLLIQENSRVVPTNEQIPSLIILDNYSIVYELNKIDSNRYFGCYNQSDRFTFGYFDTSLNKIDESIIFYFDGSVWFSNYNENKKWREYEFNDSTEQCFGIQDNNQILLPLEPNQNQNQYQNLFNFPQPVYLIRNEYRQIRHTVQNNIFYDFNGQHQQRIQQLEGWANVENNLVKRLEEKVELLAKWGQERENENLQLIEVVKHLVQKVSELENNFLVFTKNDFEYKMQQLQDWSILREREISKLQDLNNQLSMRVLEIERQLGAVTRCHEKSLDVVDNNVFQQDKLLNEIQARIEKTENEIKDIKNQGPQPSTDQAQLTQLIQQKKRLTKEERQARMERITQLYKDEDKDIVAHIN
ncbi:hypothetical protein pb186bvf_019946, partial [Paramecium bursaria]